MAGQHATLLSEVSARRGYTLQWSVDPGTTQHHILGILDRDTILDAGTVRITAQNGAALTGTLGKAASGTAASAATAITTAQDFDTGMTVDTNYSLTLATTKGVPSENLIPAGSALTLNFSGAPQGALGVVTIAVRLSDNIK